MNAKRIYSLSWHGNANSNDRHLVSQTASAQKTLHSLHSNLHELRESQPPLAFDEFIKKTKSIEVVSEDAPSFTEAAVSDAH